MSSSVYGNYGNYVTLHQHKTHVSGVVCRIRKELCIMCKFELHSNVVEQGLEGILVMYVCRKDYPVERNSSIYVVYDMKFVPLFDALLCLLLQNFLLFLLQSYVSKGGIEIL